MVYKLDVEIQVSGQRADGRGRDRDARRAGRGDRGCGDRRRYQGVRRDEQAKANVAVWTVSRMAPKDRQTYTLTLSQAGTAKDNVRGTIRWMKPTVKTGANDAEAIAPHRSEHSLNNSAGVRVTDAKARHDSARRSPHRKDLRALVDRRNRG